MTPARLLGLLDKAKAFPLLNEHHPEALAGVDFRDGTKQPSVTDCGDYEVRVNEAFRFDLEDTLVFRLTLQNKTLEAIEFAPERVRLKVGDHTLFPSVTQLGGLIPANGPAMATSHSPGRQTESAMTCRSRMSSRSCSNAHRCKPTNCPSKNEEGFKK